MCKHLTKIFAILLSGFLISCGDGKNLNDSQNKSNDEPTLNQDKDSKKKPSCCDSCEKKETKEEAELKFQKWIEKFKESSELEVIIEDLKQAALKFVKEKEPKLDEVKAESKANQIVVTIANQDLNRQRIKRECYSTDISEIQNKCIPDFYDFVEVLNAYN